MASPNAKYSHSASNAIIAVATATTTVDVYSTKTTTTGINTAAVATRVQVIQTVLTGRLPVTSQNESGFPTELYSRSSPLPVAQALLPVLLGVLCSANLRALSASALSLLLSCQLLANGCRLPHLAAVFLASIPPYLRSLP